MLHKRCHITFAVKQFCNEEGPFLKGEEHAQMLIDLTVEGTQLFAVSGQQLIFLPLQKPDREPSKTYSSFVLCFYSMTSKGALFLFLLQCITTLRTF